RVEEPEAIDHHFGGHRSVGPEEAGTLQRCAKAIAISVDDQRTKRFDERSQIFAAEPLGEPVVEKRDAASAVKQIVAWMRVSVERVKSIQAAGNEAMDRFGHHVSLTLTPTHHLIESG